MNLEFCEPGEAARRLNTMSSKLDDNEIKGALISIFDRLDSLQKKVERLEAENKKNVKAIAASASE